MSVFVLLDLLNFVSALLFLFGSAVLILVENVMDRPNIPGQIGYLTLNSEGAVLASGGDLDNDEKTAAVLQSLIGLAHSRLDPKAFDQGFKRLTVMFDDHAYVVCLSNRKVHIVKRQLKASE